MDGGRRQRERRPEVEEEGTGREGEMEGREHHDEEVISRKAVWAGVGIKGVLQRAHEGEY